MAIQSFLPIAAAFLASPRKRHAPVTKRAGCRVDIATTGRTWIDCLEGEAWYFLTCMQLDRSEHKGEIVMCECDMPESGRQSSRWWWSGEEARCRVVTDDGAHRDR